MTRASRIAHIVVGESELEQLEVLDGKPREYLCNNEEVACPRGAGAGYPGPGGEADFLCAGAVQLGGLDRARVSPI